ncbi:MAG TPA: glycosyltransferase family 2 protein, partial [Spirochaetota bacterium]
MKLLSICIPTCNRAHFLRELLSSISLQFDTSVQKQVEICISDNASTDDTRHVITQFEIQSAIKVRYQRNKINIGFDRNYKHVADMAKGKYCWVIGSDDTLPPDAINKVLSGISSGKDILLFDRNEYSLEMKFLKRRHWLSKTAPHDFNLQNDDEFSQFCALSDSIGSFFSYISSVVFSTEKWRTIQCKKSFLDTGYVHVFMLCSFIKKGGIVRYIPDAVVNCRLDNDQYLREKGPGKRFLLDF